VNVLFSDDALGRYLALPFEPIVGWIRFAKQSLP
jgi:hypothetical protein